MAGSLVHVGATVQCIHQGSAQPTTPNPRVKVSGQPIVTQTTPYTIAGCPLASVPQPPCVTGQWVRGALRVKSNGSPVILQDSQAVCAAPGTGLLVVTVQQRVRAT